MNLNVRLFFKINALVGQNRWLDAFARAGAELVIVAMAGWFVVSSFVISYPNKKEMLTPLLFCGGAWLVGFALSALIGVIVKRPRPHVTYPESKLLFQPLSDWKSFPSDHAMSAWLLFFMAVIFSLPWSPALLLMALWVSWSRVYAGVHYPLDIVGGISVAGLVALASYIVMVRWF